MNRFGYQFFTRSAFSRDKHGSIGTGNPGNGIQNVRQSLTLSYNMTAIQRITLFLRYFGRQESAWEVAKRYNTTIPDILAANQIEKESDIPCEKLLLIPKKRA